MFANLVVAVVVTNLVSSSPVQLSLRTLSLFYGNLPLSSDIPLADNNTIWQISTFRLL